MANKFPPPRNNQAFFVVSAIEAGTMTFRREIIFDPLPADVPPTWDAPTLCFLLRHSSTGEYILFDNGIRKDLDALPPVVHRAAKYFGPFLVAHDAADRIAEGGLDPAEVKQVVVSHAHFDHVGDLTRFPAATVVVSKGTQDIAENSYPANPDSPYVQDMLPASRICALDPDDASLGWVPLGPFAKALDLLGDGSAYVVDAPGHVVGHINLLARTSADGAWVLLAADSVHDWRLLQEGYAFAAYPGFGCMHVDKELAMKHVGNLRELEKYPRMKIVLAHDVPLWELAKENAWEGFWPKTMSSL
jgi:glyoxylase-like metal-dependent hydrolase (beta-lactamase superfamily II)